ncbi:glutamate racemase [Fusobacterium ulcerans]|uniref:glutamate racemase n=1 Tax=Fusobacterium ulcerans TaxID=861 RepID=UPI0030A29CE1
MKKNYNIGVFDSGVGGTTVLKRIIELLPNENIIYYGDNGNAPYGEKTIKEIQGFCLDIMDFFMMNNCKAVVIACNTATAASLELIKEKYTVPVIGVISPGAKSAVEASTNKCIGVLSTPFTAASNAYADEIAKYSKTAKVYQEGCPELCPMIEAGWETFEDRETIIKNHISKFPRNVDTVVLGCTHYPIAKEDIARNFCGNIVDPARETSVALYNTLKNSNLLSDSDTKGKIDFFVSGDKDKFRKVAEQFLGFEIKTLYRIEK